MFHVIKGYFIVFDDSSVNLCTDTGKLDKDGKPVLRAFGYYGNVGQTMEGLYKVLVKEKCSKKTVQQLEDLRQIVVDTQKEIKEICKKLKI